MRKSVQVEVKTLTLDTYVHLHLSMGILGLNLQFLKTAGVIGSPVKGLSQPYLALVRSPSNSLCLTITAVVMHSQNSATKGNPKS